MTVKFYTCYNRKTCAMETHTIGQWAKISGVGKQTIVNRLHMTDQGKSDWTLEDAIWFQPSHTTYRTQKERRRRLYLKQRLSGFGRFCFGRFLTEDGHYYEHYEQVIER